MVGGTFGLYQLRGNRFEKLVLPFNPISWAQGIQSDGKGHLPGIDSDPGELSATVGHGGFTWRWLPRQATASGPEASGVLIDGDTLWYGCGQELCRMDETATRVFGRESGLPGRALMVIRKDRDGISGFE